MPCAPAVGEERQIRKRRRGTAPRSCAECRRLKLRCDRQAPCQSCIKRGCAAICPEGSLTTGQGNRFVLASTEELHEKIQVLAYRVRTLEDGLRESHAKFSSETHPLLESELLAIKAPLQREPQTSLSARSSPSAPASDLGVLDLTLPRVPRYEGSRYSASSPSSNEGDYDEPVSVPLRRQSSRAHTPASALQLQVDRPAWTRRASTPQYITSRPDDSMHFNQLSHLFPGSHDIFDTNLTHQLPAGISMDYQYHNAKIQMNWDSNDVVFDMGMMSTNWNDFIPCN